MSHDQASQWHGVGPDLMALCGPLIRTRRHGTRSIGTDESHDWKLSLPEVRDGHTVLRRTGYRGAPMGGPRSAQRYHLDQGHTVALLAVRIPVPFVNVVDERPFYGWGRGRFAGACRDDPNQIVAVVVRTLGRRILK
jgi:hypothetical protein